MYNSLVRKLQSLRCPWCSCSCLSCVWRVWSWSPVQLYRAPWCGVSCSRTDNGVPVDLSPERGARSLRGRNTQLPRLVVVNSSVMHHRIHRLGTTPHTQTLLHGSGTCYSQQCRRLHLPLIGEEKSPLYFPSTFISPSLA